MNEMQVFQNPEFGKIRTVAINGEPWLVGKDVAVALGYESPRAAVSKKVDSEDKGVSEVETPSGKQQMTVINESGLYSLIFSSKLQKAKEFKRWVTSEVLPSIRRTGGYGSQTAGLTRLAEQMAQAATAMVQVASTMTTVVDKLTSLADRMSSPPITTFEAEVDCTHPAYYGPARCKLESFPKELVRQVEEMLAQMKEQQNLNFSMIARFCTINGHAISSPAVKTYYQKYFSED